MSGPSHRRPRYGLIFIALFVLTVLEITATKLPLQKFHIVLILVAFAVSKASLVAMFYMHLRFEKILLTVLALAPLLFSVILTLMVGFDIRTLAS